MSLGTNDVRGISQPKHSLHRAYVCWKDMLHRCYNPNNTNYNNYKECSVVERWFTLSNFLNWFEGQNWADRELDKDILFYKNTVYSPENCVFVDRQLNRMFGCNKQKGRASGIYPMGVSLEKGTTSFVAEISDRGVVETLGWRKSPEAAHKLWQERKAEIILASVETLPDDQDKRSELRAALELRASKIQNDLANGRITEFA